MFQKINVLEESKIFTVAALSGLVLAMSLNLFLIPANVFASGFTGLAQILAVFFPLSTGILLFILNIPVAAIGWYKVGKKFTLYSFVNVAFTTLFLEIIPVQSFSNDIILNSVFGGVIGGIGAGVVLKWGASSAGVDILALLAAKKSDRPLGVYFFAMNAFIVMASGLMFGMEKALYTLLTLYVASRIIDTIHTRHVKLTAMIVTSKADELQEAFHKKVTRGVTRLPARGGYSREDKEMLMIVITRYELYLLKQVVEEVDPQAFTNIVQTTGVFGMFRKDH
ncbi:YitT family protein [Salipaludibacillus sp. CUR1]|uniref:YitT family protein n=1 Tax=Salipaludibacillus sp. CUR1 TaxID=2820003 RepID=UPI001E52ACE5|nr:YitT family protein [Salipaludibacillus sp. CUR1]MCE7794918.1 YitT family protein [Salipaludibacillus sp. CUR1]